jgi:dTMP kinase
MAARGKFITLEGVDGAGKSSHIATIVAVLERHDIAVKVTREPGGTEVGEKIREVLLRDAMHLDTETLLMFAARAEHLHTVIAPAIEQGLWVVSDRFTDATFAYQGGGRGLPLARVAALEAWVQQGRQPDLTLYFDLPVDVGLARRQQASLLLDRFEQEDQRFFERVRAVYQARAAAEPDRIRVIHAEKSLSEVKKQVEDIVTEACK